MEFQAIFFCLTLTLPRSSFISLNPLKLSITNIDKPIFCVQIKIQTYFTQNLFIKLFGWLPCHVKIDQAVEAVQACTHREAARWPPGSGRRNHRCRSDLRTLDIVWNIDNSMNWISLFSLRSSDKMSGLKFLQRSIFPKSWLFSLSKKFVWYTW